MDPTRFDDLVRSLARPASRRGALGVAISGALALLDASTGAAKRRHHHGKGKGKGKGTPRSASGGNSNCAKFCAAVFGSNTPAANQCTSDAAHGKGLCAKCGTAAPSAICCTRNSSNFCTTYAGANCPCGTKQKCCSGTCTTLSTNQNCHDCGDACTGPDTCGGGGTPGVCGHCTKKTCADYPGQCGTALSDGCGGTISCGCTAPDTCGGGNPGTPGVCGCTPLSVCKGPGGAPICGAVSDGCGSTTQCNCPNDGDVCIDHACCTPATKCAEGTCGTVSDGCSGTVDCGCCPNATPCTVDTQCCSGVCNKTYATCLQCIGQGGPCIRQEECCAGSVCVSSSIPGVPGTCFFSNGSPCQLGGQCVSGNCSGNPAAPGVCIP